MKLIVTDIAWGINRVTGKKSERVNASITLELVLGDLPPIGVQRKVFSVTELTDSSVTLLLNAKGQTVTLSLGESYTYRPRSMDGGHMYQLSVE